MSIFRPVTAPQVITFGVAALLPVTIGPTVPMGSTAASQAVVAYRAPQRLTLPAPPVITQGAAAAYLAPASINAPLPSPWPYVQTMLPEPTASQWGQTAVYLAPRVVPLPAAQTWPYAIARPALQAPILTAAAYLGPTSLPQPQSQPWPYTATLLPEPCASQFGIPDSDLIFDRLWPLDQRQPAPWPYSAAAAYAAEPYGPAALTVPFVYTPPVRPPDPQRAVPWPHTLAQPFPTDTGAMPPNLGTQIPPSPVVLWLEQPPYPFVATMLPRPTVLPPAPGVFVYTWTPVLNPVRCPDWPYASTAMPTFYASAFAVASVMPAAPTPQMPATRPWSYGVQQVVFAPILSPVSMPPLVSVVTVPAAPWAYSTVARVAQFATGLANIITGPQAPPTPVRQWMTQPPWSYALVAQFYSVATEAGAPPAYTANSRERIGHRRTTVPGGRIGPMRI